jgi:sterol 14-demethylase
VSAVARATTDRRTPPRLPGGLPFLGHALEFHRDPIALLTRGRQALGEVFSFVLAGKPVAFLSGPQANEAFFRAPDDQLSAKEAYQFTVPMFGKGIAYDAAPEVMDEQLGLVFPALRDERLQVYARVMEEEAEAYCAAWGDSGEVDLLASMNELTVFMAGRCLIGREFRQGLSTEFARLYHDMEASIHLLAMLKHDLPLPSFRRRDRARIRMGELIARTVQERKARGVEEEDFLQTLMAARYASGRSLTDDEITGLLLTLLFAGQHTSAVQATWTGVLLLENPGYLAQVRQEQVEVVGPGRPLSLEAVRKMVILERALKEAERLHPPLVMLMRAVLREFDYAGYAVPAGSLAMVSPAVSHRIPEVFGEPDRYDPDRFAPPRLEDKKSLFALIGFGGGKHRCIGSTFAYQQIRVIWSVLLRRFELELIGPSPGPDYSSFVVGPRPPCRVRYRRRPG